MKHSAIIGHDFSNIIDVDGKIIKCLGGLSLALSGLQQKQETVISAPTGVGKSLLSLQIATSISMCKAPADQVPTLWIPLEMSTNEIIMRAISQISGINNYKVQTGILTKEEVLKVKKAIDIIAHSQFYMKKPREGSIDEIFSIIDEFVFKHGIKVVILDYIQLLSPGKDDKNLQRWDMIGRASKILANQVADALNLSVICVAQQNREGYKPGQARTSEQIGGAYQISQDAHNVLVLIDIPSDMKEDSNGCNRKCFVDKRRGGMSDIGINMNLDSEGGVSLRMIESVTPQQLLGLANGLNVKVA